MCFVTYLPYQEGFLLTSNRDEHRERPRALPPRQYTIGHQTVFYPKDGLAGGTWIATSAEWILCLLNGAFEKHVSQPPYRRSRGQVVLDFFVENDLEYFVSHYNLIDIEPFTLVVVGLQSLHELRWDGHKLHQKVLNPAQSYAWSSVTLYSDQIIRARETWFEAWQKTHTMIDAEAVMEFHQTGGHGDVNNALMMKREGGLQTVSITQVQRTPTDFLLHYLDQLNGQHYRFRVFEASPR